MWNTSFDLKIHFIKNRPFYHFLAIPDPRHTLNGPAGHVERTRNEKMAEIRCPESGRGTEARKTENAMGGCLQRE